MPEARPFKVAVSDDDLHALWSRLRDVRWADDVGNADGSYGVRRRWLEDLVDYWGTEFDWRAQERTINALPGLGAREIAEMWHELMIEVLGYARYGGGDWGSIITGELGHGFSESLIG